MTEDIPLDEMDEVDDMEDEDFHDELGVEQSTPEKRARHAITGRGVTLQMLMADGIIKPGDGVLSLEYLGQKFTADLQSNGKIKSNETDQIFSSPSSWAIFCKKLVNPAKKSGCGWASVKYKGRKLDSWKTSWFRQQKPRKPHIPGSQSPASSISSESMDIFTRQGLVDDSQSVSTESATALSRLTSCSSFGSDLQTISSEKNESSSVKDSVSSLVKDNALPLLKDSALPVVKESTAATAMKESPLSLVKENPVPLVKENPVPLVKENPVPLVKDSVTDDDNGVLDLTTKPKPKDQPVTARSEPASLCFIGEQEEALNLSLKATPTKKPVKNEVKVEKLTESPEMTKNDKTPVKHSTLPERSNVVDMNQLVSCDMFTSLGKMQPYTVSMSTNSLLLMDFHCHLTTSEVVGYLGGKWDQSAQHLSVQQAFPCRCRLSDSHNAALIEEEIRSNMKHLGMSLVGWYHSHPYSLPEPSVRDLDCQMSYQLKMKGAKSTYFPCVGIINSPYYRQSLKTESTVQMYMVMPPLETSKTDYGIPMSLKYSVKQNHSVSEELLAEMKKLVDFYKGAPDWISFEHSWHPSVTYLEKLKTSLGNKLPEDQLDNGTFMEFVQHVLTS